MAETYGGQGLNTFTVPLRVVNNVPIESTRPYSIVYNRQTNVSQIYIQTDPGILGVGAINVPVGTINYNTGARTLIQNAPLNEDEKRVFQTSDIFKSETENVIKTAAPNENPGNLLQPRGTQPAPAPGAQAPVTTPGSASGGPNSENPNANIDPQALTGLGSQLENFGDPNTFKALKKSFLKYPTSIDNGQDRIIITQIEYVPSGITADNTNINQISELLGNRDSQLTKSLGVVVLPMPNDISETNQTGWGESSLSTIAAALMNPAAGAAQKLAGGNVGETVNEVKRLGGLLGSDQVSNRLSQFLTANAAASLIKLGGINVDPEAYLNRVTGVAINPNLELLFNGPKLRQFGFSFKMTPRSPEEARNIRSIVKFFKKGMAPRRSTVEAKSIYLGTPNVFKLKFVTGADKDIGGIGRIKTCALVSCTVNYTPDGFYAAYDGPNGSQPIATVMQLAFTELTPVYNDEYDAKGEGAENSIGPEGSEYKITGSSETTRSNYTLGARQGPTPGGASVDTRGEVGRIRQRALIDAAGPLPGGG